MVVDKRPRTGKPRTTTIPLRPETKDEFGAFKLSDGEESWDHLTCRVVHILRAAQDRGILQELAAT